MRDSGTAWGVANKIAETCGDDKTAYTIRSAIGPRTPLGQRVTRFHLMYDRPVRKNIMRKLDNIPDAEVALRINLIAEEFAELMKKGYGLDCMIVLTGCERPEQGSSVITMDTENGDERFDYAALTHTVGLSRAKFNAIEICDAHSDLRVVLCGADIQYGANPDDVDLEVMASNMTKLGPDGKPILNDSGKILKGPSFVEPNIQHVLGLD